jgi:hypothetical protein
MLISIFGGLLSQRALPMREENAFPMCEENLQWQVVFFSSIGASGQISSRNGK